MPNVEMYFPIRDRDKWVWDRREKLWTDTSPKYKWLGGIIALKAI